MPEPTQRPQIGPSEWPPVGRPSSGRIWGKFEADPAGSTRGSDHVIPIYVFNFTYCGDSSSATACDTASAEKVATEIWTGRPTGAAEGASLGQVLRTRIRISRVCRNDCLSLVAHTFLILKYTLQPSERLPNAVYCEIRNLPKVATCWWGLLIPLFTFRPWAAAPACKKNDDGDDDAEQKVAVSRRRLLWVKRR